MQENANVEKVDLIAKCEIAKLNLKSCVSRLVTMSEKQ